MSALLPCPSCARHVRSHEPSCPFCASALPERGPVEAPRVAQSRAQLMGYALGAAGLALSGCVTAAPAYGAPPIDSGPADASMVDAQMVDDGGPGGPDAAYGGPPFDAGSDSGPVAMYGGPPPVDAGVDAAPVAAYGSPGA